MGRSAKVAVVLSVAKLTPGQERYYEQSVAAGLDEYYEGHGESPGVWTGRGAQALGLEGRRPRWRTRPAGTRPPSAHREAAARTSSGEGSGDHDRAHRPADRRAQHRDEEARPGRRVRPRLLAPEERQLAPRPRRRGDPPRRQRGPSDRVAGGARVSRGRSVRNAARRPGRESRARPRLRRCRLPAPDKPGPGSRTFTRT